jgi:hypothetical protein
MCHPSSLGVTIAGGQTAHPPFGIAPRPRYALGMRAFQAVVVISSLFLLACGDDAQDDGSGGSGASSGTGAGGSVTAPPTPDSCDAPIVEADVSSPTSVVGSGAGCGEADLDAALAAGGVVTFDCGTGATIAVTSPKVITQTTVIDGGGEVTLSGGDSTRIFLVETEVDLTLQNLTLADARVNGPRGDGPGPDNSGAAVFRHSSSTLNVLNVTFRNNHATSAGADIGGGAIYSYGGDTVIVGSTFDGNSASGGGAIGNLRSNLAIYNSSFANNNALDTNGGAVALDGLNQDYGKVFTLCGVIATNNHARIEGGAVYRYGYPDESSVIDSTTLDGNFADDADSAAHAGGLYHHTDTPGVMPLFLSNSTISNNTSANSAGAMFFYNSPVELTNVTIANNSALDSLAGAIAANGVSGTLRNVTIANNHADDTDSFAGAITGAGGLTIVNTIIAHNTAGNEWNPVSCTESSSAGSNNLQFPAQQQSGQDDTPCVAGIDFADPLLGPLQDNGGPTHTMALLDGSPAIGTGSDCPATDQRGVARDNGCDLGAYQHED